MVTELDAAVDFYGKVTNWTFADGGAEFGHYRTCLADGRAAAGLGPAMSPDQPAAWTVYFASEDVDATAKLITENGGAVLAGPMDIGEICRIAIATDDVGAVFGVFQRGTSIGTEVVQEPGALVWESGVFADVAKARAFYGTVLGLEFEPIPGMEQDVYGAFKAGGEVVGGIGGLAGAPEGTPNGWTAFIEVADVDTAVAAAVSGGAKVLAAAEDTPFGRMGTLIDPFGAVIAVHGENNEPGEHA
ncbi:MAG TPA: VOC family protein [Pseudonocardia sp.]|jgi:hypothetical protein